MQPDRLVAIGVGLVVTGLVALPIYFTSKPAPPAPAAPANAHAPANASANAPAPPDGGAEATREAPPIALKDFDGNAWSLASLRDKRAALVVFWASW